jgi:hypothetical protein
MEYSEALAKAKEFTSKNPRHVGESETIRLVELEIFLLRQPLEQVERPSEQIC